MLQQINEIIATKKAIAMYSTHKEGKSVVVERFIRTFQKYMTSVSKNVFIDIVNK